MYIYICFFSLASIKECEDYEIMEELVPENVDDVFILYSTNIDEPENTPTNSPVSIDNNDRLELFPVFFPKNFRVLIVKMTLINVRRVTVNFYTEMLPVIIKTPVIVSSIT